jgi:hypothetical protein
VGYAGAPESLAGKFRTFGSELVALRRQSLLTIFQFPFRHARDLGPQVDQADLDSWIAEYNEARPHQGRWCFGETPMQTFLDATPIAKEKMIAA